MGPGARPTGLGRWLPKGAATALTAPDDGTLPPDALPNTPLARILSSAVGHSTHPVVTPVSTAPGDVWLLCTDGLTKHVPDDRIAQRLREMTSTDQVCHDLVQDALDGGGTDNVTIVVGRRRPRPAG